MRRNGPIDRVVPSGARRQPTRRGTLPKIVSLFSGAGGLDLGFKEAGYKIAVALDSSDAAIRTHRRNFPQTKATVANLIKLQPQGVVYFVQKAIPAGERIAVIGGPPCQGFSRANVGSQPDDPRNKLPKLYLDIVSALQNIYTVEFIVFENVLGMRDKKHAKTYKELINGIAELGFDVTEKELCATDFGVPQNRHRIVLSGLRIGQGYSRVKPRKRKGIETVRHAIGSLKPPAFFKHGLLPKDIPVHPNHWTMQPRSARFENPELKNGAGRSFRRLNWDAESPTIAFGHREIHIHPSGSRRLSIYEAMLLQGFPKKFVLEGNLTEQVEQVSNAVPPPLARSIASAVTRALDDRLYREWRSAEPEHEIFREFIEKERNNVVKEYAIGISEGPVPIAVSFEDPVMGELSGYELESIGENIYRPMTDGTFEGEDGRTLIELAIQWWEKQLDKADKAAATIESR